MCIRDRVLGVFVKKVPHWAAWSTVLIGFCVSFLVKNIIDPDVARSLLGLEEAMTTNEVNFYFYLASVFGNILIAGTWFMFTTLFYSKSSPASQKLDREFFERMETPVLDRAEQEEIDQQQRTLLGNLSFAYGGLILLMALIPNSMEGRLCFLFCGGIVCAVAACLRLSLIHI